MGPRDWPQQATHPDELYLILSPYKITLISLECVCVHMNHYIYLFSLNMYERTCAVTRLWTSQDSFQESAPSVYHVSLGDQLGLGNKSLHPLNHLSSLNTFQSV